MWTRCPSRIKHPHDHRPSSIVNVTNVIWSDGARLNPPRNSKRKFSDRHHSGVPNSSGSSNLYERGEAYDTDARGMLTACSPV